jgi:hypothetical protein
MAEEANEEFELDPSLLAPEPEPERGESVEDDSQDPEEDIPEKYRGKSARELIEMHQSAERVLGRQGNEIGQIRSVLDDILTTQKSQPSSAPPEPDVDFFEDPKGATSRIVADTLRNDPTLQGMQRSLQENEKKAKAAEMARLHPDFLDIAQSSEFQTWLSNDNWRLRTFQEAGQAYDTEAAASLLNMYKESANIKRTTEKAAKSQKMNKVRQASTGSGKASAETRGRPKLSREALIQLKMTDPDKYLANMKEIKAAYLEGRAI